MCPSSEAAVPNERRKLHCRAIETARSANGVARSKSPLEHQNQAICQHAFAKFQGRSGVASGDVIVISAARSASENSPSSARHIARYPVCRTNRRESPGGGRVLLR